MRLKQIKIVTFDELSPKAKDRARAWLRESRGSDDLRSVIEDADRMASILGFTMRTHTVPLHGGGKREDPSIWWSLSYGQGDGAWIEAGYQYAKGADRKIRAEAPVDTTLHAIADRLRDLQKPYGYALTATINDSDRGPMNLDLEHPAKEVSDETYAEMRAIVRELERWIYSQLRTEDEYQNSDEQIDESIRANEYEFTEDGEIE